MPWVPGSAGDFTDLRRQQRQGISGPVSWPERARIAAVMAASGPATMCAGAELLAARGLSRRQPLLRAPKLSFFAGMTNKLLIYRDFSRSASYNPALARPRPLSLISGMVGARVAPSRFNIRLNFTCSRHEPRTMRLLARRHHRLIDTRRRDNRNFARFGASFTPSL